MKQISEYKWHDVTTVHFDLEDGEGGHDRYEVYVDYWFVKEPMTLNFPCISYVEDVHINTVKKNGEDIPFIRQTEVSDDVQTEVREQLEYAL